MPTVADWIHALRYEVGTLESPAGSNNNPYSRELGRPAERWCADFLAAMSLRVGVVVPSRAAYTPSVAHAFQTASRWHTTPQPGDYVFYNWVGDDVDRIQHVGVVVGVEGHVIHTVEGNTSSDNHGDQSNGGGVFERTRRRDDKAIVGYGRPTFNVPPEPEEEIDLMLPRVVHWNQAIFLVGYDDTTGEPWRRTFPNPSRLAQVVGGGGCVVRPDGNAFDVTNDQFELVYADRGPA